MRRLLALIVLLLVVATAPVHAQEELSVAKIYLNATTTLFSGSADPEGSVAAPPGSLYLRSDGTWWRKATGSGATGWVSAVGVSGTGTPGTLPKWLTSSSIGDSLVSEAGTTVTVNAALQGTGYVSQTTAWGISAAGGADFRYLFADELHAKSFITDLEQALAGGQIISKSVAVIAQAFTAPAASGVATLWVRDLPSAANMAAFEAGDAVVVRSFSRAGGSLTIADCVGVVTAYADGSGANEGQQSWTFTRNAAPNAGTMAGATVVAVDSLALDYGTTGNGYYEVNAIDGLYGVNSPYAQVVTWATSPVAANRAVRTRLGKLTGITGTSNEYGLLAGSSFAASNGQYIRASNEALDLHGVNLQMWDGSTNVIKLDRTAPSFALGNPLPSAYGTGAGVWMGKDAGVYKFRVGNPAGNQLTWNGTSLTIAGDGDGITNIDGGNIQTNSITASKILVGGVGAALNDDPGMTDVSAWPGGGTIASVSDGVAGLTTLRGIAVGGFNSRRVPIDATKTYRLRLWVRRSADANSTFYGGVSLRDSAGGEIAGDGMYWLYYPIAITPTTTWTAYDYTFGAGTARTFPANARTMAPLVLLNLAGTLGYHEVQDVRIEEVLPSTLIQDGAITTDKVAANAITAGKISVTTLSAITADLGTITAGSIGAGTATIGGWLIGADSLTANSGAVGMSSFVSGGDDIRFWAGDATPGSAEFRVTEAGVVTMTSATITGYLADGEAAADVNAGVTTISGGKITTGTIDADRMNVSTLSAITADLGTITAGSITGGTIDGATIKAGSGDEVLLDANGMTLTSGTAYNNAINWSDGSQILSDADTLVISAGAEVQIFGSSSGVRLSYTSGAVTIAPFGGSGTGRFVCHDDNGDLYSSAGTCDGSVAVSESATAMTQRIQGLEREVAELRALIQSLLTRDISPSKTGHVLDDELVRSREAR